MTNIDKAEFDSLQFREKFRVAEMHLSTCEEAYTGIGSAGYFALIIQFVHYGIVTTTMNDLNNCTKTSCLSNYSDFVLSKFLH